SGGRLALHLDAGSGSAPDAEAEFRIAEAPPPTGPWSAAFASWREMLDYVVPQDRALSVQPGRGCVTRQEIRLDIAPESCTPLEGTVRSRAAAAVVGAAEPFCFHVEKVRFRFDSEACDPL